MRVAWIQANSMDESLAIADVAGVLRAAGFQQRLFLDRHEPDLLGAVARWGPDVAIVQAAFMAEPWLIGVLQGLRSGLPVILVGTAATFDVDLLLRVGAPMAAQGEPLAPPGAQGVTSTSASSLSTCTPSPSRAQPRMRTMGPRVVLPST